jgi:hypothetical protein
LIPRDLPLERHLTLLAAEAGGHVTSDGPTDHGLRRYADQRTWPGGLRHGMDWDTEAYEEIADLANYLVWGVIQVYDKYVAGDPEATRHYERRMRALVKCLDTWTALRTEAH